MLNIKVKDTVKENLIPRPRRFDSRKAFYVYTVCWAITVVTMLTSIVLTQVVTDYPFEKMVEHVVLCVVGLVLLNFAPIMYKHGFSIPAFIQITITIMIFAHFVLGEVFRFYDWVMMFDKFLHLTNGLVIAACGFSVVCGFNKTDDGPIKLSPFFAALFSACFSITLLTLWEFLEYMIDSVAGINMQRWRDCLSVIETNGVKTFEQVDIDGVMYYLTSSMRGSGLIDTMHDLMIGAVGAVAVSVAGGIWFKKNPGNTKFLITRNKKM